jgi:hypothetical protein
MRNTEVKPTLDLLTIATNKYFKYWQDMVKSADQYLSINHDVTAHVFSNEIEQLNSFIRSLKAIKVVIHEISDLRWPEVALKRYEIITTNWNKFDGELLMYIDADMIFETEVPQLGDLLLNERSMALVKHPGYRRPSGRNLGKFYLSNLKYAVSDISMKLKLGSLGAWETSKQSTAFVKRTARKNYYCGGCWFGTRLEFFGFTALLADEVMKDTQNNVEAIWLDESHLNKWASENEFTPIESSFCFDETYPQLEDLSCIITAVDKSNKYGR